MSALVAVVAAVALPVAVTRRVVVEGRSMAPGLLPGDRLLVARVPAWWPLRPGSLVAVPDPRRPARLLVKRAAPAGSAGALWLSGDNPGESTDSRAFGTVPRRAVVGVAWYRYGPPGRAGRLGRGSQQVSAPEAAGGGGTL